jgi:MFS family permease
MTERTRRPLVGLLTGATISVLGTRMSALALPWFALVTTGSVTRTGLVAFAEMTPYVLVGALGGPFVDRVGPVRAAVAGNVAAALAVGAVPALHAADLLGFGPLLAVVAVAGAAGGLAGSGQRVLVPATGTLAGTPLERVAGLFDGLNRLATLLGAPVAGALLVVAGAPVVLAIDAVTFAVCALVLLATVPASVHPRQAAGTSYLAELRAGFNWLVRQRVLLGICVLVFLTNLIDQAWSAVLLPAWVRDEVGDPAALGAIVTAFGVGAVAGNALFTWLGPRLPRRLTFAVAFLVAGPPPLFVLAASPGLPAVLVVTALGGLAGGALNPIIGAVSYERVPTELRARVLPAINSLAWAGIPLGGLLGGWVAGAAGLTAALLAGGGLYLLATLGPFVFPAWRDLDRRGGAPAEPRTVQSEPDAAGVARE